MTPQLDTETIDFVSRIGRESAHGRIPSRLALCYGWAFRLLTLNNPLKSQEGEDN